MNNKEQIRQRLNRKKQEDYLLKKKQLAIVLIIIVLSIIVLELENKLAKAIARAEELNPFYVILNPCVYYFPLVLILYFIECKVLKDNLNLARWIILFTGIIALILLLKAEWELDKSIMGLVIYAIIWGFQFMSLGCAGLFAEN